MALSANTIRPYDLGEQNELPVKASEVIYEGSAVGLTAGYARALTAGDIFGGFALEKVTGTASDGGETVRVKHTGQVQLSVTSVAVTDIGKSVYASDDGTFSLTAGSNSFIGTVHRFISSGVCIVKFDAQGSQGDREYQFLNIPVTLANVADGDVVTGFTPGYAGRIESMHFIVTTAVTTASKATTLNAEIGTTNTTGGALALTSANCDTLGDVVAASAITAANTFTASDTISIEASSTTPFAEGAGVLVIKLSREIN